MAENTARRHCLGSLLPDAIDAGKDTDEEIDPWLFDSLVRLQVDWA